MSHRMFTLRSIVKRNLATAACLFALAGCSDDRMTPLEPEQPRFSVGSQTPTVVTVVHDQAHNAVTEVGFNQQFHVHAFVSGGGPTPTGTVTITRYQDSQCTVLGNVLTPIVIDGAGTAQTLPISVGAAVFMSFRTHYSGDANYAAGDSNCAPISVVGKLTPAIAVAAHDPAHQSVTTVPLNTSVHVSANITGAGPIPTGTVARIWWANGTCSGAPISTDGSTALVGGNGDIVDAVVSDGTPGAVHSFGVNYSGDANYNALAGGCVAVTWGESDAPVPPPSPLVKLGSIGYWKNWRKQYAEPQLQILIDYVKSNYAPVFNEDQINGTSDDLTAAKVDAIYGFARKAPAQQNVLAHFSALTLDIALTQLAPQNGLSQPNSSICTAGETDVSGIGGASALFGTTSPTIGQVANFVAARWDGSLTDKRTDWSFNLTQSQSNAVLKTLAGINDGSIVKSAGC